MGQTAITRAAATAILVLTVATSVNGATYFAHPDGAITGGLRWDAAPRTIGGNERSLDGGLRYSLQGGSFEAYRDLIPWFGTPPSAATFQLAVEQAFAAWESTDPVTGLGTAVYFVADLSTTVIGSENFDEGNPNGAEIDLLAIDGGFNGGARTFFDGAGSTVTLTSGTPNYAGSPAMTGADITINIVPGTVFTLDVFRRLLTHEIGHALGLGDVDIAFEDEPIQFVDDNYNGATSASALATLTNSWALSVNPLNPAASPLSIYNVPHADPGTTTPGVDILMESNNLGISPSNPTTNLVPLRNDDYGMRQFLYPSLTFDYQPGDFNHDGTVDAADYVTWRDGLGSTFVETDYIVWRAHFGNGTTASGVARSFAAAPEPNSLAILIAVLPVLTAAATARSASIPSWRTDERVRPLLMAGRGFRAVAG